MDLLLAATGLLGLGVCAYFIFFGTFTPSTVAVRSQETVARTTSLLGEVRRRPHATLAWDGLRFGAEVHQQDTVFVPDNGELLLAFRDGSELHIEENSLVVITFRPEPEAVPEPVPDDPNAAAIADELQLLLAEADVGLTVEVVRGGVSGRSTSDAGAITIASKHSRTRLKHRGEARVRVRKDASAQVHVVSGEAVVASGGEERTVGARTLQGVGAEGGLASAALLSISLRSPGVGERVWIQGEGDPIDFAWEGGPGRGSYFLQLSRDSEFQDTVARARSPGTSARLPAPEPGVYFWRVGRRGETGTLRSEERRLVVVADTPPVPLQPRHGEIVYVPGGGTVAFGWAEVSHAAGYRIRIARDRKLKEVVVDAGTELPGHWQPTGELPEGVYYWSVRIEDPDREVTPWGTTMAFRLITRPLPEPPRLFDAKLLLEGAESPDAEEDPGGEQGSLWPLRWLFGPAVAHAAPGKTQHRLRWSQVPGIELYEVEIAADEDFGKVIHRRKVKARYLEWTPPSLEKDYWYRVRSIDPEGRPGKFAKPKVIRAPNRGPSPVGPPEGTRALFASGAKVRLAWDELPGTVRYEVQVARQAGFGKIEATLGARGKTETSWELPAPGLYHWRVRAIDAAGRTSVWGRTGKVDARLSSPTLRTPSAGKAFPLRGGAAVVKLAWRSGPSRQHEVQVARDPKFRKRVSTLEATEPQTSFRTGQVGRYHFRVRSRDEAGRWSGWSRGRSFRVFEISLRLKAPAEGEVFESRGEVAPVVLSWSAVARARRYRITLTPAEGGEGTRRVLQSAEPTLTVSDLEPGIWEWRVQARAGRGPALGDSEERRFEIALRPGLQAPQPTAPAPGASFTGEVTLSWTAVEGAGRYEFVLRRGDLGAKVREEQLEAVELDLEVLPEGEYAWQVRALDETGYPGSWSEERAFRRVAPAAPPPPPPAKSQLFASLVGGGSMTLGTNLAWEAGLGIGHRPRLWGGRTFLELGLRFGQHSLAISSADGALSGRSTLRQLPIVGRMGIALSRGRLRPQLSLGVVVDPYWASARVSDQVVAAEQGLLVGGRLGLGLEALLGPGHLVLELELNQLSTQTGAFEVGGTSFATHLGYRWRIR